MGSVAFFSVRSNFLNDISFICIMSKNHPEDVGVKDIVGCLLWLCEKLCYFKNCDKNDIIGSVMRVRRV